MFKIIFFLVALDFHKHCYGNLTVLTQFDLRNSSLTQNVSSNQISSQNTQSQITFETKLEPKIENTLEHSIETNESHHGSQKLRTRDSQHFLKQVVGYQIDNLQKSDTQSPKKRLQDFVETKHQSTSENTIGLMDNVRFFRRNQYWKPKRLISFNSKNYPNEQDIKTFQIGYENPFKSHEKVQNQVQVFSGCCTVMSNTILIRNSGAKSVHNFNAPDYLPPIDKTTSKAPEYLPPNSEMEVPNGKTTTVSCPDERGDIPDEDGFITISPVIAMLVPPEYDEIAEEPPDTPVPTTSSAKVNIPTTDTSESNSILTEEKSLSATTPSFKGIKYLPSEDTKKSDLARLTPQSPTPEPAMAIPVPPEPDDNDSLPTPPSTSATKILYHHQTKESRPPSSFTITEYSPPKSATIPTFSSTSSGIDPALAMLVPPEPDDKPSTYSPPSTDDLRSAGPSNTTSTTTSTPSISILTPTTTSMLSTTTSMLSITTSTLSTATSTPTTTSASSTITSTLSTTTSSPIIPDTNPFQAPKYLPPKEMVPVPSPANIPMPEPDCILMQSPPPPPTPPLGPLGPNEPKMDPRSLAADPCQSTQKPNQPASDENPKIDPRSPATDDPCLSTQKPK